MKSTRLARWAVSWPPTLYLLLLLLLPTLMMVLASFRLAGEYAGLAPFQDSVTGAWNFTVHNYTRLLENTTYVWLFFKSLLYAGLTTLCCVMLAYPVAWTIARSQEKWRNLLLLLVILPFWSNFLIRVYAWMMLLGTQSGLNKALTWILTLFGRDANAPVQLLYTPFAVLIALVYVHLPFMVLPLYANLEKHDTALLDAAQDLGANVWQRFWRITFPLSLPGIYAGAALVFIPALGMFAIPDLLGGTNSTLIANEIKQMFLDRRDWPTGSALSMLMSVAVLLLLFGVMFFLRFNSKLSKARG